MAYHHGSLRTALLRTTAEALAEGGPTALSLRAVARRAGVSHAAPAHHFVDKAGLLTAFAAEGFDLLAEALKESRNDGFLDVGVAYVQFAVSHTVHFEVMFQPSLYRADEEEVVASRERAAEELRRGAEELVAKIGSNARIVGLAAWSMAHGFASLWLSGSLPADVGPDASDLARVILASLDLQAASEK
jgi:AcrR family transcriptional regulator